MAVIDDLLTQNTLDQYRKRTTGADLQITTAAWDTPITVDELKSHLHITHSVEDTDLSIKLKAAVYVVERATGLALMQQTLKETFDRVGRIVQLSVRPVLAITSIKTITDFTADTQVLLASSNYTTYNDSVVARESWPTHRGFKSFEVIYTAGFAQKGAGDGPALVAARAAVPEDIKLAIMDLAGHFYTNREGQGFEAQFKAAMERGTLPSMVSQLLTPWLDWGV